MPRLLLLDFDGTLCLGEDPILVYAAEVDAALTAHGLSGPGGQRVTDLVAQALETNDLLVKEIEYDDAGYPSAAQRHGHDAGSTGAHPSSWPLQDGYQLVQLLGVQCGLTPDQTGYAFRQGRRTLLDTGLENTDVHAPEGAGTLLGQLREAGVVVVLLTNAPEENFGTWLTALGLESSFDTVINSAQKPVGMPAALRRARETLTPPVEAEQVLAVGDIWANDLAHPHEAGGQSILIDRFGTGLGTPSHRVTDFAAATPLIRRWAGCPDPL